MKSQVLLLIRLPLPRNVKIGIHFCHDGHYLAARTEADTIRVFDGGREK